MRKETLFSPVSGIVSQILMPSGSIVKVDELILNIEVMKLFYEVTNELNGKLELLVHEGEFVQEGQELGTVIEV